SLGLVAPAQRLRWNHCFIRIQPCPPQARFLGTSFLDPEAFVSNWEPCHFQSLETRPNSLKGNPLSQTVTWSVSCMEQYVPISIYAARQTHGVQVIRRILEYCLAASAALLCSYLILGGHR